MFNKIQNTIQASKSTLKTDQQLRVAVAYIGTSLLIIGSAMAGLCKDERRGGRLIGGAVLAYSGMAALAASFWGAENQ